MMSDNKKLLKEEVKEQDWKGKQKKRRNTKFKSSNGNGSQKFYNPSATKGSNDAGWYFKDAALLKDVASFSFNKPLGTRFGSEALVSSTLGEDAAVVTLPGLMTIETAPSVGISLNAQSPLNLAAQNVYQFVRYKNSGSKNYDAPDLMLYYLAMDSLYSCWCWMKRLYGMASTYSAMNRYMPRAWFKANMVDFDDLMSNLADFRAFLNMAADRISVFSVPNKFTFMQRHVMLYSSIYKDQNTRKSQQYMFVPSFFYKYEETTNPNGGQLVAVPVCYATADTSTLLTVANLKTLLNTLIDALMYSEDIGVMSGDTLKAYEAGGLFTLSHIDADYKVDPVYNPEILSQIENCHAFPAYNALTATDLPKFTVSQDPNTNWLLYQPVIATNTTGFGKADVSQFLNMHHDGVTPEEVIVATRLNLGIETTEPTSGHFTYTFVTCGSEIPMRVLTWRFAQQRWLGAAVYDPSQPMNIFALDVPNSYTDYIEANQTAASAKVLKMWAWNSFDWHPPIHFSVCRPTGSWATGPAFWEWDNCTLLTVANLDAMNSLALQSEFNIPN